MGWDGHNGRAITDDGDEYGWVGCRERLGTVGLTHGARDGQWMDACDMGVALSRACSSSVGMDRPEHFEVFWKAWLAL
jgi:hypothetical protein